MYLNRLLSHQHAQHIGRSHWRLWPLESLAASSFLLFGFVLLCCCLRLSAKLDSATGLWLYRWATSCAREFILVDLVDHLHESFLHVDVSAGTRFVILHVIVSCKLFGFLSRDSALVSKIALVADEKCGYIRLAVLVNSHDPSPDRLECLWLGQVEADHHALRLLVERHGEGLEALLACRIPNFQVVPVAWC